MQPFRKQLTALAFVLLLLGGEAYRVKQDSKHRRARAQGHASNKAQGHASNKAHAQQSEATGGNSLLRTSMDETRELVQQLTELPADNEVARGWLRYKDQDTYAILRKRTEVGSGVLELYTPRDVNPLKFVRGEKPKKDPFRTLIIRADDAVMLEEHESGHDLLLITGEKHYFGWEYAKNPKHKTMTFVAVDSHLSMKMLDDDDWVEFSDPKDVVGVWLNLIRTLQVAGGSCLAKGECLVQCTYLEELGGCSSEFCTMDSQPDEAVNSWANLFDVLEVFTPQRQRCHPREGNDATLEGWAELKRKTMESAEYIYNTGCVASCSSSWDLVSRNVRLMNELVRQYAVIEAEGRLPPLAKAFQTIKAEATKFSEKVATKIGEGFDYRKNDAFSLLKVAMRQKGCDDIPDGSMQALFKLDAAMDHEETCVDGDVKAATSSGEEFSTLVAGEQFVPWLRSGSDWYPLCGHYFWDNNNGATTICKSLGFESGQVHGTWETYETNAMPVGMCGPGQPLTSCDLGGNAWADFDFDPYHKPWCQAGNPVGARISCSGTATRKYAEVTRSCNTQVRKAQASFQIYQDACPWFKSLVSSPDAMVKDNEALLREKKTKMGMDPNATKTDWDKFKKVLKINGDKLGNETVDRHSTALLERGTVGSEILPLAGLEVWAIVAIIASIVTILAGVALIFYGSFCSPKTLTGPDARAHEKCKSHLQKGSPCWKTHTLPGIYIAVGGVVMLALTICSVYGIALGAIATTIWESKEIFSLVSMAATQVRAMFIGDKNEEASPANALTNGETNHTEEYQRCMKRVKDTGSTDLPVRPGLPAPTLPDSTEVAVDTGADMSHVRPADEDSKRRLEEALARLNMRPSSGAATTPAPTEDANARRMRELEEQLAALRAAEAEPTPAPTPAPTMDEQERRIAELEEMLARLRAGSTTPKPTLAPTPAPTQAFAGSNVEGDDAARLAAAMAKLGLSR